jgi:predicted AAA+ superfamily ATPase
MFNRNIIDYLEKWKIKSGRKPLVLRGARQVGKTFAVKFFATKHFTDFIYLNLERAEDYELFKDVYALSDFEKTVDIVLKKKIIPGKTLVFIDEIQNAPNLIELLRFFYEERAELHVIAAGSLLEAKIQKQGLVMPVGRIEYAYVYPLTFFEFLGAVGEKKMLDFLKQLTLEEPAPVAIHERALKLFNDYALIGGMPEIVARYAEKSSQEDMNSLYSSLLTAYAEDIYKYASSAEVKYIRHALEQAPYFAGERITYEKFGGSGFRSREMSEAFEVLEKAMLLCQLQATKSCELPLIGQKKRAKKLLYLDVGFVNFKNNIQSEYVGLKDLNGLYRGKIAEQIVGQNILAGAVNMEQSLFYWAKEKPQGAAEVDFCLAREGKILGVEVKSGHSAKLKSLLSFGDNAKDSKLIRIYSGQLRKEKITAAGREYELLSLPFYLVNRIFDFY